jgi:hypothetical protein
MHRYHVTGVWLSFLGWAKRGRGEGTWRKIGATHLADLFGTPDTFWLEAHEIGLIRLEGDGFCIPSFDQELSKAAQQRQAKAERQRRYRQNKKLAQQEAETAEVEPRVARHAPTYRTDEPHHNGVNGRSNGYHYQENGWDGGGQPANVDSVARHEWRHGATQSATNSGEYVFRDVLVQEEENTLPRPRKRRVLPCGMVEPAELTRMPGESDEAFQARKDKQLEEEWKPFLRAAVEATKSKLPDEDKTESSSAITDRLATKLGLPPKQTQQPPTPPAPTPTPTLQDAPVMAPAPSPAQEPPVAVETPDTQPCAPETPAPKMTGGSRPRKRTLRDDLMDVVARMTNLDLRVQSSASRVGKVVKDMMSAEKPPTPEELERLPQALMVTTSWFPKWTPSEREGNMTPQFVMKYWQQVRHPAAQPDRIQGTPEYYARIKREKEAAAAESEAYLAAERERVFGIGKAS